MGIVINIEDFVYDKEFRGEPYDFPILIVDQDTIEFPEYDIALAQAMIELGFETPDDPEIRFHRRFENDGMEFLIGNYGESIFDALVAQDWVTMSPDDFAGVVESLLRSQKGYTEESIQLLRCFVEDDKGNPIATMDSDDYVSILLDVLKKCASGHWSDEEKIDYILSALSEFIDSSKVKYDPGRHGDYGYCEPYQNIKYYDSSIEIDGETIVEWKRSIETSIYDGIWFQHTTSDWCEDDTNYCTPGGAETILGFFDMSENSIDDPEPPSHPESDPDGGFAVLYEKFETQWDKIKRKNVIDHGYGPDQREVVPYNSEYDVNEAIELSASIFSRDGEEENWIMTPLRLKTEQEMEDTEIMRKQLVLLPEMEDEEDDLLDDWVKCNED